MRYTTEGVGYLLYTYKQYVYKSSTSLHYRCFIHTSNLILGVLYASSCKHVIIHAECTPFRNIHDIYRGTRLQKIGKWKFVNVLYKNYQKGYGVRISRTTYGRTIGRHTSDVYIIHKILRTYILQIFPLVYTLINDSY